MTGSWARIFSIALGIWLFLSAFAWPHDSSQFANTWVTGAVVTVVAALSMAWPRARSFNAAVAIWLFFSSFFFPTQGETIWNNTVVAILLLVASLVREKGTHRGAFGHRRIPT